MRSWYTTLCDLIRIVHYFAQSNTLQEVNYFAHPMRTLHPERLSFFCNTKDISGQEIETQWIPRHHALKPSMCIYHWALEATTLDTEVGKNEILGDLPDLGIVAVLIKKKNNSQSKTLRQWLFSEPCDNIVYLILRS